MQNQMEKKKDNQMEAGSIWENGSRVPDSLEGQNQKEFVSRVRARRTGAIIWPKSPQPSQ